MKPNNLDINSYYDRRAAEYERIYHKPERQENLQALAGMVPAYFTGLAVLEIACGTGYWTHMIAREAATMVATDLSPSMLEISRRKDYGNTPVTFLESDAFMLTNVTGSFTGGFCGFWWSHLPISRIRAFRDVLLRKLLPGARVMLLDNRFVSGSSTPISHADHEGNTYQRRRLDDGATYTVIKNFPDETALRSAIAGAAEDIRFIELDYYWVLTFIKR